RASRSSSRRSSTSTSSGCATLSRSPRRSVRRRRRSTRESCQRRSKGNVCRRRPANSGAAFRAILLGAVIPAALGFAPPATATGKPETDLQPYQRCMSLAESQAEQGQRLATQWRSRGGGFPAEHCEATALFNLKHYEEAAKLFHEVGSGAVTEAQALRVE